MKWGSLFGREKNMFKVKSKRLENEIEATDQALQSRKLVPSKLVLALVALFAG